MRELSVAEQRYEAVRAVLADGATVTDVAARFGVSRKTVTPPGLFRRETSLELLEHRTAAKAARDLQATLSGRGSRLAGTRSTSTRTGCARR
jgi:transposase-like protein